MTSQWRGFLKKLASDSAINSDTRMKRFVEVLVLALAMGAAASCAAAEDGVLALTGATIYPAPDAAPIKNGVVLIEAGRIKAVGAGLAVPPGTTTLDCAGLYVMAGFQNSHVHFSERKWADADAQSREALEQQLRAMLTRYGFTTVVDTGSNLENTKALRRRIEAQEVAGPRILTVGSSIYPENGIPFYIKERVPADILKFLDQPATPAEATQAVRRNLAAGADAVKLFTGALVSLSSVRPMQLEIARAAVTEAHRSGALVYSHPSNDEGVRVALEAGVDIFAHTAPQGSPWDDALVAKMREHRVSITPTLKLWAFEVMRFGGTAEMAETVTAKGVRQLEAFLRGGGQVLFGTDVGYMGDYDTADEYRRMAQAGLTPMQILSSLTTAPAAKFKAGDRRGRIAPGMDADLVVLEGDPVADVLNFSKVRYTLRAGRVIFAR
jgi:imidazolonepropionase-like amidohydrolase